LPGPRLIQIGWKVWTEELGDGIIVDYCKCIASNDHPAMLHTCHESRMIALKVFRLSFADDLRYPVCYDITRDALVFHSVATFCLFVKSGGNSDDFEVGRIPIIALDLTALSLTDLYEMRVSATTKEFFRPGYAARFDEEWKFGLFDEIAVLTKATDVERDIVESTSQRI
jgi:hypothetical protein